MSEQNDISQQLDKTLKDYGTVLQKCTDAYLRNSNENKEKIGEISALVKEIKEKIMGANNNLKVINKNREIFDKVTKEKTEQLEEAIRKSKETNAKEMEELQNKQLATQEAANKKIQEIDLRSKNELERKLQELNDKHKEELEGKINALTASEKSKTALEDKQKEAQIEIERIKEENRKQKEDNEKDMEKQ